MSDVHPHGHDPHLAHHFESRAQQLASDKLGIWLFLATEILMFGGLFCGYAYYRGQHPEIFLYAHKMLDTNLGAINTAVLLTSSLTMAWAVRAAQINAQKTLKFMLIATFMGGVGFMVIKTIEYKSKFDHKLYPGEANLYYPQDHDNDKNTPKWFTEKQLAKIENNERYYDIRPGEYIHHHDDHHDDEHYSDESHADDSHSDEDESYAAGHEDSHGEDSHDESHADEDGHIEVAEVDGDHEADELDDHGGDHGGEHGDDQYAEVTPASPVMPVVANIPAADHSSIPAPASAAQGVSVDYIGAEVHHYGSHGKPITFDDLPDIEKARTHMFFQVYFLMTGLHGLHVVVGMGLIGYLIVKAFAGAYSAKFFTPVDVIGLYWHIVDLIWIFLFPLLYLIH